MEGWQKEKSMNDIKDIDLDIETEIANKLEEIKQKVGIWEIKANISEEERMELNGIFEMHWKFINLLSRMLDREKQFRQERYDLIDKYWKLTSDKEERDKFNANEGRIKGRLEKEGRKKVSLEIDADLRKRIEDHLETSSDNLDSFFNQALIAYKDGMELTFKLEASGEKRNIFARLNPETLEVYQSFPLKERGRKAEIVLGSYLEKELRNL